MSTNKRRTVVDYTNHLFSFTDPVALGHKLIALLSQQQVSIVEITACGIDNKFTSDTFLTTDAYGNTLLEIILRQRDGVDFIVGLPGVMDNLSPQLLLRKHNEHCPLMLIVLGLNNKRACYPDLAARITSVDRDLLLFFARYQHAFEFAMRHKNIFDNLQADVVDSLTTNDFNDYTYLERLVANVLTDCVQSLPKPVTLG